jgi:1,2-phenylacetyl-CoA epoxidase catalytic subunit
MSLNKSEYRELRKAAERALKELEKSLKEEPSAVIVIGSETGESENLIQDITSWLFKEENNGNSSG